MAKYTMKEFSAFCNSHPNLIYIFDTNNQNQDTNYTPLISMACNKIIVLCNQRAIYISRDDDFILFNRITSIELCQEIPYVGRTFAFTCSNDASYTEETTYIITTTW